MSKWLEQYKGYFLICTPYSRSDGRFVANLTIEKHEGSHVDVKAGIGVLPADWPTEADAANAARIAGRKWVDDQG